MKHKPQLFTRILLLCLFALFLFCSCKETPETFAIHTPIYPNAGQNVSYTLDKIDGDVSKVQLYETVQTINSSGSVTATSSTTLLQEWNNPTLPITFTKSGGYSSNRLVNYRFEVYGNDKHYTHDVKFAISPYPVLNQPAPVYVVGDINRIMNLVFIRDTDLTENTFKDAVRLDIHDAFHKETYIRRFRHSFNFFLNPFTGHAHDYDTETHDHEKPSNWNQLSFAQGKVILHQRSIRDFAQGGNLFSTEHFNRGTIIHESGHTFYSLADEYGSGSHWQESKFPNNWQNLSDCQSAAGGRGMASSDAHQMGASGWYKLCPNTCAMEITGQNLIYYSKPCTDRILHMILNRASGN